MPEGSQPEHLYAAMSAFKRDLILRALERHDGNRSYAAASLGIDRTSLLRLIRELGVGGLPAAHNGRPPASRIASGKSQGILSDVPGAQGRIPWRRCHIDGPQGQPYSHRTRNSCPWPLRSEERKEAPMKLKVMLAVVVGVGVLATSLVTQAQFFRAKDPGVRGGPAGAGGCSPNLNTDEQGVLRRRPRGLRGGRRGRRRPGPAVQPRQLRRVPRPAAPTGGTVRP